ncbi:mothers against decapentaplegic homolog 6 [Leptopilina boulardi]|uniref:mothers against decapentaplegic homolog 6 n=1 Tax=Leptopilina boulardi TaxID=63433 RepID=UPI0021F66C68|nr:mothers against decapentaplegic homolog 6 [Leptopilina boulardi]
MFMFWNKRAVLTKRLLKAKVCGEHETECETQEDSSQVYVAAERVFPTEDEDRQDQVLSKDSKSPTTRQERRRRSRSVSRRLHHGCCGGGDRLQDEEKDISRLTLCKEFLKTLKENQLEMLLNAIESFGADLGSCVLVPRSRLDNEPQQQQQQQVLRRSYRHHHYPHNHHHHHYYLRHLNHHYSHHRQNNVCDDSSVVTLPPTKIERERCRTPTRGSMCDLPSIDPLLLCCQIWRWPDLTHSSELKNLPVCHSSKDPVFVCCNPYHWSRLCKPESPPPPYCLIADRMRPEDRAPSEGDSLRCRSTTPIPLPGSLTTNGEEESEQKEWCTLAYWELSGRVGRLYPVELSTVNVFDSLHDGDGLCLATLAENHPAPPAVQRTRSKIGLGLMLSQESDGVWAYNRSDSPIFVNSPTLDDPESRTLLVYRVPSGFCLNIFDRVKSTTATSTTTTTTATTTNSGFTTGPVDVNSVRISFAKGWGPKYSRQEVTSCPCWLEVLLAPCR